MNSPLKFKDFGFKLAVVNRLMYDQGVLAPEFDSEKYLEKVRGLEPGAGYEIVEEEGYDPIPELQSYFEDLEITPEMVADITELISDGGDEIYADVCPFWDGEDDIFDVKSAEDVVLLPSLKKATLLFKYPGDELIKAFAEKGVELESI